MGYILPITQYQYQEYQNRVTKKRQDPYYIEQPYKVILDTKTKELKEGKAWEDGNGNPVENGNDKQLQFEKPNNEKLYAKLTGKGRHFSESI